jgi:multidrug efflux system membrane fusion protein
VGIVIVCGLGLAAYWGRPQVSGAAPSRPAAAAVPVTTGAATRSDVPVYATGLGSVQASLTVAIHSQVEGQLQEVLFTEGQQVKKGDVLAKIDPQLFLAALDQAKAKKAQDAALLVAAEKDLARITALGQRNIVSRQDVEQQQAKYDQLKAYIAADDAAIAAAQTQLDYTLIRAPSSGRVGIRLVDPGNLVRTSDAGAITTLVVTHPSAVLFTLPATNLEDVRAAMARGPIEVTALDQDNRQALSKGKLLLIDNSIDTSTATIRLKAMFDNADDRLWPGEFVNSRLLLEIRKNALTIPTVAVQRGPQGLFAWVVSDKQTVEPRPIEVGPASGDRTIVLKGLDEGETVVIEGQFRLQSSARVAATPASRPALEAQGNRP